MYMIRAAGGALYLTGVIMMTYNLYKTAKQGSFAANEDAEAPALIKMKEKEGYSHRWLEKRPWQFTLAATAAILIGGLVEFIPTFLVKSNIPTISSVKPYTPLRIAGERYLYKRRMPWMSFTIDPSLQVGDRKIRGIFQSRRVCL